jgi:hypothetical protein
MLVKNKGWVREGKFPFPKQSFKRGEKNNSKNVGEKGLEYI